MLPTTRLIQTATRQDLTPMDRFLNEGETDFRAREPEEIPQDDGSLHTEGLSEEDLPARARPTAMRGPEIVRYVPYKKEIVSFKTPNVIKTHSAIRENLRQQCELNRINCHTLLTVVREDAARTELPGCGDVFYLESVLRTGACMIIFMAPEDSTMVWITWSEHPFPGGENGPVFQYFQKLVDTGELHVSTSYLPGASDHKAVYELANMATMYAKNPNPIARLNGYQDYDVIEYAQQSALVDVITRNTFTQPITVPKSHGFDAYVENFHEEEYPSDRLERILASYGIATSVLEGEDEDDEPYWNQPPPQVRPTIHEGLLVPNWLLRDPETGAFRQDRGHTYARWVGDGWVTLPTPAEVDEATQADEATQTDVPGYEMVQAAVQVGEATQAGIQGDEMVQAGMQVGEATQARVYGDYVVQAGVQIREATQAGAQGDDVVQAGAQGDEATQAGAQVEEDESPDSVEVRVAIPAYITDPPINTLYHYIAPRFDDLGGDYLY
ncbi:hypothetical protein BU16DRAFT_529638 [Lophium mytilinum]|uniref:Uncharacterized protein n=1 Tax=Lophium mytilinum TaxID=390894 RepID=A0A6A6QJ95_9PEZI|nr:hypothetical protein BU16DRAFT_529638 [Lophium mytilinum]